MKQCWGCANWLFFVPLPSENFSCCSAWEEKVEDIDLATGISPAVKRHGEGGEICPKFKAGKSVCETSAERPFDLHPLRCKGEAILFATFCARELPCQDDESMDK